MKVIRTLLWRNMLIFFKDKTAVFFSFMAVFVVLGLYIAFLGDMMIGPLKETFPNTARELSDTWIIAGTLGIVSLTTSLSVLGIVIEDKSKQIIYDLCISPISNFQIAVSYVLSTIIITFLISIVTLCIGEIYILAYGGVMLSLSVIVKVFGVMLLSILSCTCLLYYFMSFFHHATSFSNVTTIIGTLSGFLMGIYVPVGALPSFLQTIISWFPPSHGAALYREVMMEDVIQRSFHGLSQEAIASFKEQFGLTFTYGSHTTSFMDHILILITMGAFFFFLIQVKNKRRKR